MSDNVSVGQVQLYRTCPVIRLIRHMDSSRCLCRDTSLLDWLNATLKNGFDKAAGLNLDRLGHSRDGCACLSLDRILRFPCDDAGHLRIAVRACRLSINRAMEVADIRQALSVLNS